MPKCSLKTENRQRASYSVRVPNIYRSMFQINRLQAWLLAERVSISCNVALGDPAKYWQPP